MRSMQTVKDNVTTLIQEDGELTTTDQETADLLASYFKEAFTRENATVPDIPKVDEHDFNWQDTEMYLDTETVRGKLQKLHTDKSQGPDDIHPIVLRECCNSLAEPLSLIFMKSYETGMLPEDWKTAHVIPIFKKVKKTDKANYRPVSLTSVPGKVMESIIKNKL
jgi:hypothetical protein